MEEQKLKSAVRHKRTKDLLDELREASPKAAQLIEEGQIRLAVEPAKPAGDSGVIDDALRQ